jgi:hypothetical protein
MSSPTRYEVAKWKANWQGKPFFSRVRFRSQTTSYGNPGHESTIAGPEISSPGLLRIPAKAAPSCSLACLRKRRMHRAGRNARFEKAYENGVFRRRCTQPSATAFCLLHRKPTSGNLRPVVYTDLEERIGVLSCPAGRDRILFGPDGFVRWN